MVEIEAYHLLLGRPGQFGNKTIHHGEKNGPAFYENGLKGSTSLDKKKSLMILR